MANVLLEGVPRGMSLGDVRAAIVDVPGVQDVHDLHVWSITSGSISCSVHIVVNDVGQAEAIRSQVAQTLSQSFHIEHTTIQTESRQGAESQPRTEEHTPELQSLMRNSSAVFCVKKKKIH